MTATNSTQVIRKQADYLSSDGDTKIEAYIWASDEVLDGRKTAKAILQISHGMSEHIMRYDEFAKFMAGQDFIVCGNSHAGHGGSLLNEKDPGHLPYPNGSRVLVDDVHTLRCNVQNLYGRDIPYFVLGHSMGSFVIRTYITRYAEGLAGAIVVGTGHQSAFMAKALNSIVKFKIRNNGLDYHSKFLDGISVGAYSKKIKDAKTSVDWLSYDQKNIEDYINDTMCGFTFALSGFEVLSSLLIEMQDKDGIKNIPDTLPVVFVSGSQDPVGNFGVGVMHAFDTLLKEDKNVTVELFDNMRHEILNEADRQVVYDYILQWMQEQL